MGKELIIAFLPQDIAMSPCVEECDFNLEPGGDLATGKLSEWKIKDTLVSSGITGSQCVSFKFPLMKGQEIRTKCFPQVLQFCVLLSVISRRALILSRFFLFVLLDGTRSKS